MKFTAPEAATLHRVLRWRRDVRHFRTDPINEPVLTRLRDAMDLAPSVGNARPWRVIRVTSQALRAAVRADFIRCNAKAVQTYDGQQREDYLRLKLAGLDNAPLQLAVFTVTDPPEGHALGRQSMPDTLNASTSMAIHTLWLAARVENLGLGMVSILDPVLMERLFDTPADWRFSAYLCLGHPEFEDDKPLLHRTGWQDNHTHPWEER
ncbi:5,6-dimethylbenzimidazole synthase [Acetobacter oeni]|uniref:5,6-dimethylbenzimidazole synthase n=1 Tax=Acetobacter oeni TaxID=304077 RepID=A0A511XKR6_9PROT|nr:5,6-dimethylbenzimidazole synthase [Acetobacter oeni]MBB3883782.1 5,6-dimethylbenzimidazole synthase [Acetobacter oeni]NHO19872.1 5,6-dimethylbenzimidazole synthase [Acetobacter oeni]GBR10392.1 nitroreductase [Acetobacter oeni LMG 21952]GEN63537.1 5,6-dimethylbenzimidazole synthase [Acetobacter oeni]